MVSIQYDVIVRCRSWLVCTTHRQILRIKLNKVLKRLILNSIQDVDQLNSKTYNERETVHRNCAANF